MVDYLSGLGYLCERSTSFTKAADKIAFYDYDIVLLDLMLPDGKGLDLLGILKKNDSGTGILIISAKDSLDDKLAGLNLGADDYITKPFHLPELNARINALVRRKQLKGDDKLQFGAITMDMRAQTVSINGGMIGLTKKEFALLRFFMINKGRVLSKQSIAEHLWGDDYDLADNYDFLYVHINNLRKKLISVGCPDYIKTIYGMGYKFIEP